MVTVAEAGKTPSRKSFPRAELRELVLTYSEGVPRPGRDSGRPLPVQDIWSRADLPRALLNASNRLPAANLPLKIPTGAVSNGSRRRPHIPHPDPTLVPHPPPPTPPARADRRRQL